jgi:G-protein coupled receptor 98
MFTAVLNLAHHYFFQAQYVVYELKSQKTLQIPIYRGMTPDGSAPVGPAAKLASVNYFLVSDSAKYQQDFLGSNGTIRFDQNIRTYSITIYIQPDTIPENFEKFKVVLANPVGDIVLADPKVAEIVINPNDDHNGILEMNSKSGAVHPSVKVNEDTKVSMADLSVIRRGGSFGSVSVKWTVTQVSGKPVTDVTPTSGTIEFKEKETEKPIMLMIVQDTLPEVVEMFKVALVNDSVTGGARLGEVTTGSLMLEDSDVAYGAFEFASGDKQKLESVSMRDCIQA